MYHKQLNSILNITALAGLIMLHSFCCFSLYPATLAVCTRLYTYKSWVPTFYIMLRMRIHFCICFIFAVLFLRSFPTIANIKIRMRFLVCLVYFMCIQTEIGTCSFNNCWHLFVVVVIHTISLQKHQKLRHRRQFQT